MRDSYEIKLDGDLIVVRLQGAENIGVASRLWPEVVQACREHNCYRVLGIADTTEPLSTMDSFDHAELFERLGINHRYRIAWVELNPDAYDATSFTEIVLSNRALPGRLFDNVPNAKEWLLGGAKTR